MKRLANTNGRQRIAKLGADAIVDEELARLVEKLYVDEEVARLLDTLYVLASAIAGTSAAQRTLLALLEERGLKKEEGA